MRRTAVERGKDADNAPLLLGGQGRGRARYLNSYNWAPWLYEISISILCIEHIFIIGTVNHQNTAKFAIYTIAMLVKTRGYYFQWEFQDLKMEVLYYIRPYFVGIFPYIGLIQALYMESVPPINRFLLHSH